MSLLLAGVTAIFEGTNPRALRARLQSMLPPSEARSSAA
jgi:flagellar motor component MotA